MLGAPPRTSARIPTCVVMYRSPLACRPPESAGENPRPPENGVYQKERHTLGVNLCVTVSSHRCSTQSREPELQFGGYRCCSTYPRCGVEWPSWFLLAPSWTAGTQWPLSRSCREVRIHEKRQFPIGGRANCHC